MNLIKLIKYGEYRNYDKISRLKSISSIEDNYLEAATRVVLYVKAVPKNFGIFIGKQLDWSLFLIKLQACNTGVFLGILQTF